ncbi:amino acid ABC transporter substrate-binding protein [Waterburya agarophytonicola K14]|uniref:Amino acid ABC transporter substrate-binding protein n=1 Tax=Waterburya agarophytonicola KI4 TaxID=2874699 RepID=A0A964BUL6_9CYAN|nr:ABC transporter substrate-binding protein [Waterburya agarophytonicola]MCC0178442.1 amino acid ABC transporter substrate-binding protein [Waterburya agarophytonicola KI4]
MSKKSIKAPPPIVFILLFALGLLGWFKFQSVNFQNDSHPFKEAVSKFPVVSGRELSLFKRFSLGERMLITANFTAEKKDGTIAYGKKKFAIAQEYFEQSLTKYPNDPETRIYLNNAQVAHQKPIKVAAIVPIGSNLDVAQEMLRGIAQAQTELILQGVKLQIQIVNDENNTEIAEQVAKALVKDSEILAVIGSNASNASLAGAKVYQQNGMVMITPTSTTEELSNFGDYIFRTAPTNQEMADALADYVVNIAKRRNVAICFDSQAPDNVTFKDAFIPALIARGGNYVNTQCDFATPDFNGEISVNNIISSGAEAVLLAPHIDKLNRAIDLARANNWKMVLLGTFSLNTSKITQSGQGDLNGVVLPVPFHYQQDSAQEFMTTAYDLWGKDAPITWRTGTSYDATKAISLGLQQNNTREGLKDILRNSQLTIDGSNNQFQFLPSGDRTIETALVKVKANPQQGYYFELLPDSQ